MQASSRGDGHRACQVRLNRATEPYPRSATAASGARSDASPPPQLALTLILPDDLSTEQDNSYQPESL